MQLTGNKILITGGATGIGFGLSERFIEEGNTVIICGRRDSALQEAADKLPSLITKQCDLENEDERIALYEWIAAEHPDLNVLINNAGVQNWMSLKDPEFYKKAKNEISINIESPLHMMLLFKELGSLHTIMNVTSALAFSPLTKVPVYSATKAFFHSLTLSFRHMLRNTDIELIEIIPPVLNTDLGGKGIHDSMPSIDLFIDAVFEQLKEEKTELTYGFSDKFSKIGQPEFQTLFGQMNPVV
ncbi:SDR family oxidoreductase [Dyadobacter sp. CY312]|uniref:SDR family oxidoreductase n=1 Tax=Dyadobacter sp. CY312 TaxID=2907303 RepID=UPI001F28875D|nr:SDR family NAD(P)-dependent oxidoreductase [Dyadobacter sp. CY312]MCE7040398.1 SDR family NAD(P)-dependent oxidoreductase [Dyadobacter sp. CY312]